jgi:hypothetical protein
LWEECGDHGIRCYYRARELEGSRLGCAQQLYQLACDAGYANACLHEAMRSANVVEQVRARAAAVVSDVRHETWRFYATPLLLLLAFAMLVESVVLRAMGWSGPWQSFGAALLVNLITAPVALVVLAESDKVGVAGAAAGWVLVVLIEWWLLRRLHPSALVGQGAAAFGANLASALVMGGGALLWVKYGPTEFVPGRMLEGAQAAFREVTHLSPRVMAMVAGGWLLLLVVEACALRLVRWGRLSRTLRDAILMNLVTLVPAPLVFLTCITVFGPQGRDQLAAIFVALGGTAFLSWILKWGVLARLRPQPMSRPGLSAFFATSSSYGLLYAALIAFDWLSRRS